MTLSFFSLYNFYENKKSEHKTKLLNSGKQNKTIRKVKLLSRIGSTMILYTRFVRPFLLLGVVIAMFYSATVLAWQSETDTHIKTNPTTTLSPSHFVLSLDHNDARVSTNSMDESLLAIDDIINVDDQEFLTTGVDDNSISSIVGLFVMFALCIYFLIGLYIFRNSQLPKRLLDNCTISISISSDIGTIKITHRSVILQFLGIPQTYNIVYSHKLSDYLISKISNIVYLIVLDFLLVFSE